MQKMQAAAGGKGVHQWAPTPRKYKLCRCEMASDEISHLVCLQPLLIPASDAAW